MTNFLFMMRRESKKKLLKTLDKTPTQMVLYKSRGNLVLDFGVANTPYLRSA
jgi:hypothetical protein